jgi:hypothetical protein
MAEARVFAWVARERLPSVACGDAHLTPAAPATAVHAA